MPTRDDVIRLIENDANAHISFLSSLIRIPSPNPPGDTVEAVRSVQRYLRDLGIASEIISPKKDAPNLVSTLHGQGVEGFRLSCKLVLNGHIDHFPNSSDERWERDPYSGDITEEFVHGLGAVDMKAGEAP